MERILASNRGWHRRDIDAVIAAYSSDIEWDTRDAWPDGRLYSGRAAFRVYCDEVLDRWAQHRLEIDEIFQVEGTSTVVVRYRMTGRSRSGVPIDGPWVHVFDFQDGEIVRGRNFRSLEAVTQALGGGQLLPIWQRRPQ